MFNIVRLSLVSIVLAACQPAATLLPTITPQPTPTMLPSATPEPPTPTLTATLVPPTRTPTALPVVPTANFEPASLYGIWTRSDPDRGTLFLIFLENGAYRASHGEPSAIVHSGKYTLAGTLLTIVDGWNCSPAETTPGTYILKIGPNNSFISLTRYQDECPDRPSSLHRYRWNYFSPAP